MGNSPSEEDQGTAPSDHALAAAAGPASAARAGLSSSHRNSTASEASGMSQCRGDVIAVEERGATPPQQEQLDHQTHQRSRTSLEGSTHEGTHTNDDRSEGYRHRHSLSEPVADMGAAQSLLPSDNDNISLPEPPRGMEVRPPPLNLEQRSTADAAAAPGAADDAAAPPPAARASVTGAAAGAAASASSDDGARGAHVDVAVFKYQPGVQVPSENFHTYRVNLRGAALTGGLMAAQSGAANAAAAAGGGDAPGTVDIAGEYERRKGVPLERHFIKDHRAKQLLVVPSDDKFVAVAAPEAFSRHSGTCMILGGQGAYAAGPSKSYELRVGSLLRIGSVGVVVSETHTGPGGAHKCLSWEELTCLKGDIAAIQKDLVTVEALTAQEEGGLTNASSPASFAAAAAAAAADRKMCYMCFDDEDEPANPLVAPCDCKGDTRYVHLGCLQRWHTTTSENKVCVVLNNKGVRVCTVCKSPYKPSVRLPTGESISLFQSPLPPPYICFMVVTKHQNNEDLFSTKYQLSFSSVVNRSGAGASRGLVVGRSRQCDMVLDYRTVSTRHAMVKFAAGGFHFSDLMSSNGSYLYMREPLQLPYGETVFLKWGSNVVSLKAKRSIRHRLSTLVGRRGPGGRGGSGGGAGAGAASADFSMLESLCELGNLNLTGAAAAAAEPAAAAAAAAPESGSGGEGGDGADEVSMVSLD